MASHDTTCPKPGQFALYRFYDASEELLYVGFSNEPWRRRKQHSITQPWYPQVRHQAITWYDSERAARCAEDVAIQQERPHFNVAGAIRPTRLRLRLRASLFLQVSAAWAGVPALIFALLVVHPVFVPVLAHIAITMELTCPLPLAVTFILAGAPSIRRFGAWLERNTVAPGRSS